jgi:Trk-type K+ transport system membrane component
MLIWLCYWGIFGYLISLAQVASPAPVLAKTVLIVLVGCGRGLEVLTVLLAHSRRVREATKGASMAKEYVYHEGPADGD